MPRHFIGWYGTTVSHTKNNESANIIGHFIPGWYS